MNVAARSPGVSRRALPTLVRVDLEIGLPSQGEQPPHSEDSRRKRHGMTISTDPRQPIIYPTARDARFPSLLDALAAIAEHRHQACHGIYADADPGGYAQCALHDLVDPLVPLPEGAVT
jgi:hypothetical protein